MLFGLFCPLLEQMAERKKDNSPLLELLGFAATKNLHRRTVQFSTTHLAHFCSADITAMVQTPEARPAHSDNDKFTVIDTESERLNDKASFIAFIHPFKSLAHSTTAFCSLAVFTLFTSKKCRSVGAYPNPISNSGCH